MREFKEERSTLNVARKIVECHLNLDIRFFGRLRNGRPLLRLTNQDL
jgi:hypothetical protein